ncbi:RecQ family ATP-dependent DNA helicase [Oscillatoria sp. FACHB-1406]|uniref:RecQ family ATP-dependent DNA helicase n=1 Tax=Oscillatoria sp. FACHB-1406 TaxID=2692846 RepID=UPI0016850615|nr:RecQ family ATP-dependent DNA helicase [Oscillatoria sp. FACHB-1406]MBD2580089.1 RecQ family ATP-dependent DNA helicase [Oscillatoria sp. FACHB-1406]
MMSDLHNQGLSLLRTALNDPEANFRDGQWDAISQLLNPGTRLLAVQRTGWGKSLIYFLTTRLLRDRDRGITLIISPLLALMRNQISAAQRLGLQAETINSTNPEAWEIIQQRLLLDTIDLLLISPERLANNNFREEILLPLSARIGFLVVDEAHCISDWGHDFRPDYRRIVRILQALPKTIPVLATTATANNRVIQDIRAQLGSELKIARGTLARESLCLQNISLPCQEAKLAWLAEQIPNLPGSGIIYALTVRDSEQVAEWLKIQNIDAESYSAQVPGEQREILEQRLLNNQIKALVATSALSMGFDKPDLGFVIHYQRPGSVVHYYQQVGRAGRAVLRAYGILLSGNEDQEITNYFIESAFPPENHIKEILDVLARGTNGLSLPQLETQLNIPRGKIEKALKFLSLESPAPIAKIERLWYLAPIDYKIDREKIERLTEIRKQEQARMLDYINVRSCLMKFLARELDDPTTTECGRCTVCLGKSLLPETYTLEKAGEAVAFLRRKSYLIEPRKKWAASGLLSHNWKANTKIPPHLQAEPGRTLSLWGDAGWGTLVKQNKYRDEYFSDTLVNAVVESIQRWQIDPFPTWITCIPSLTRPELVPNFCERLARELNIPFVPCVQKNYQNRPQKEMQNSSQQVHNLDGVFRIDCWQGMAGDVFLIDDMVDSRWTFTVVAALLRQSGSGKVFPFALALNSLGQGE